MSDGIVPVIDIVSTKITNTIQTNLSLNCHTNKYKKIKTITKSIKTIDIKLNAIFCIQLY